jgi:hypothetical protein
MQPTLLYKRDHIGDPDERGCFGVGDCMGSYRKRDYGAYIGVGGLGRNPKRYNIAGKVNWIGIGPEKQPPKRGQRGPCLTFKHFLFFGTDGPELETFAPNLAKLLKTARGPFVSFNAEEQAEIDRLLALAYLAPPSTATAVDRAKAKCPRRRCRSTC